MPAGRDVRAPLAVACLVLALFFIPRAASALELSRDGILHGQCYRLLTGHLIHFTFQHLFWDLLTFIVLSLMVAGRSLNKWLACTLGSALVISFAVLIFQPEIALYRGLSGIDSALFATAAAMLLTEGLRHKKAILTVTAAVAIPAFIGKSIYELGTGRILFVEDLGPDVSPLVLAHLAGAAWGLLIALLPAKQNRQRRSP